MGFYPLNDIIRGYESPVAGLPGWSAPRLCIISASDEERAASRVNVMLDDPALRVVGIGPATTGVHGNEHDERWPAYVVTVIYQERIFPDEEGA